MHTQDRIRLMQQTQDLNVVSLQPMLTPRELKADIPMTEDANSTVVTGRRAIQAALHGEDDRMLAIVGPCSIHDPEAALEYAGRLRMIQEETRDRLVLVMRTYFEKPRTTIGWKGLINDPHLDGSYDIDTGLRTTRSLLLQVNAMGMPTATELLDPIVPQYIADLVSWASIGARTTESQTHREMASGLSMPVGFKNSTDGNMQVAVEALESARHAHHFLGIDQDGKSSVVATRGNAYGHLILRGGRGGANYDPVSIAQTEEHLAAAGLDPRFVVDCSHANSGRRFRLQRHVLRSILQQRIEGARSIVGFMIESNLEEGNQPFPKEGAALRHGVSITDPCIGWDETAHLLRRAAEALRGGGPVVF
jgi:3-deoxy-7-phosphoheptulonate synthase